MRMWWVKLCWSGIVLFGLAGCRHLGTEIKPPKEPEVLRTPPEGVARYDSPMLPKEAYANTYDPLKKSAPGQMAMPGKGMGGGGMGR